MVVSGTSRRQRSDGSSDGGAAIGMRCDYWLRPPYYLLIAKNNTLRKSAPLRCSREHFFLPPGALFCSGALFFVPIIPRVSLDMMSRVRCDV